MSHPIKQEDLNWVNNKLNDLLKPTGVQFKWSRRYGYYAIDYTADSVLGQGGLHTHRSGLTKSETYQILHGMYLIAQVTLDHKKSKAQEFLDYALGK